MCASRASYQRLHIWLCEEKLGALDLVVAVFVKSRPEDRAAGLCRPLDGDSAYCSPDSIARRMAAGEAVSVRELPAPRFPALATLGFAPASYPSRPRERTVRPGPAAAKGL